MTRENVVSNGYPQIIEDASHGSLQSVFVRHPGQRRHVLAARYAALGIQPDWIDVSLSVGLRTTTVWACLIATARRQSP